VKTPLVLVNDFQDLIVDKLLAFFGRAEPRDAVDLYFILKSEDVWELVKLAAQKDPGFDLYWLALALDKVQDFPDELDRWPVEMLKPLSPVKLKDRCHSLALEVMDRLRKGGAAIKEG
jgi:hypothetical protein